MRNYLQINPPWLIFILAVFFVSLTQVNAEERNFSLSGEYTTDPYYLSYFTGGSKPRQWKESSEDDEKWPDETFDFPGWVRGYNGVGEIIAPNTNNSLWVEIPIYEPFTLEDLGDKLLISSATTFKEPVAISLEPAHPDEEIHFSNDEQFIKIKRKDCNPVKWGGCLTGFGKEKIKLSLDQDGNIVLFRYSQGWDLTAGTSPGKVYMSKKILWKID